MPGVNVLTNMVSPGTQSDHSRPREKMGNSPHCLEYIIVHEMLHLLERRHNDRFLAYLDMYLSNWKPLKTEVNTFPVSHAEWTY